MRIMDRRQLLGLAAGLPLIAAAPTDPSDVRMAQFQSRGRDRPILVMEPTTRGGPMSGAAVMLLHGSGGLRSSFIAFHPEAVRYAAMGYLVTMPNYFSDARDAQQSDDTDWWARAVADAAAWTASQAGVQPGRLGALGYSRGGYLAAEVAVRETDIAAVVGVASAGNVPARQIVRKPPVLLIHADGDPVIPPRRTRQWAQTLRGAGVPVETIELDSNRHEFDAAQWTGIFDTADGFFRRTLAVSAG
jgi:dipeptidyl aminopeptidase/acylaminoacyl peptidase